MPAGAASLGNLQLRSLIDLDYYYESFGGRALGKQPANEGFPCSNSNSLDELYGWYQEPASNKGEDFIPYDGIEGMYATATGNELAVTNQTPMWLAIVGNNATDLSFSETFVVNRDTRIGADIPTGTVQIAFNKDIVINSGTLMFKNEATGGGTQPMNTNIILSQPIVVSEGGSLILENRVGPNLSTEDLDTLIAPADQPAIIVNGGTVHSGCFEIKRADSGDSNTPLIQVNSGELIFEAGNGSPSYITETGMPTYETIFSSERTTELDNGSSTAPAVVVASGAKATVKGANFESDGTAPIIEVQEGATLVLDNETGLAHQTLRGESFITAKGENTPAILVKSGGALTIAADTENNVTATKYQQAIELESGAEITVGEAEPITVGGGEEAENYFDNNGIAVLAAGAMAWKRVKTGRTAYERRRPAYRRYRSRGQHHRGSHGDNG